MDDDKETPVSWGYDEEIDPTVIGEDRRNRTQLGMSPSSLVVPAADDAVEDTAVEGTGPSARMARTLIGAMAPQLADEALPTAPAAPAAPAVPAVPAVASTRMAKTMMNAGAVGNPLEGVATAAAAAQASVADAPQAETVVRGGRSQSFAASRPSTKEGESLADRRVGQDLGGYRVIRKLAEGGMGVVYEAEHSKIGRKGAIKVLKAEFCQDPTVIERFYQEARAVNEIGHENIVDIFDFGETPEGGVFFVMDFLEGMALSDRIKKGPVPWTESLLILRQTIRALQAAHAKGFVHRDLKPDNIFLEIKDGATRVKLLDFGIAKLVGLDGAEDKLTRTGSMIGTPHYMSPEQINGSADIDHRTDIYSLGIIMYEMFSGATPFQGNTLGEIITGHLLDEPPRLSHVPADLGVPQPIADIIHRMLAKKPGERYDAVQDVLSDLVDIDKNRPPEHSTALQQSRPMTGAAGGRASVIEPAQPTSRMWMPIAGVAAAALLVGGALFVKSTRDVNKAETPALSAQVETTSGNESAVPAPPAIDYDAVRGEAQELIRNALKEAAPGTRVRGSDAAGDTLDPGSAVALFELAQSDPSEEVRGHAARALGKIGHADARAVFAGLEKDAAANLQPWYAEALLQLGDDSARKRLGRYAKSKELGVALKATLSLVDASEPGDKAAIKALTELATREAELNEVVPYAGALILTKLAALRAPGARGILYDILEQPDESARMAAAEGLARLGDDGGAAVLSAALAAPESPNRLRAALTLVLLGDYSGYAFLAESLSDEHSGARATAARGLGYLGEKRAVEALVPLLKDDDWSVRVTAAVALVTIVGLDPALLAKASVDWAGSALQSEDWAARRAAADVLGDLSEKQAAPLLAQAIADTNSDVRVAAARSAAKMRSPEIARTIATAALIEKDVSAQEEQVKALGSIGSAESADVLRELSADTGRVGVFAAGSLIAVGDASGKERLVEAVSDKRTDIRMAAVESATRAKNETVVPVLVTGAQDTVFDVRFSASEGLALYGQEKGLAVPVLESGLDSKSVAIKARAQVGLAKFGVTTSVELSTDELLASSNPEDRLAAVAVVESKPWAQAKPLLMRLVADPDLRVRRASVDALGAFVAENREGVKTIYKSLTKDSDLVTRAKVQAQLSKLVEPLKSPETTTPKVAQVVPTDPLPAVMDAGTASSAQTLAAIDSELVKLRETQSALDKDRQAMRAETSALSATLAKPAANDEALASAATAAGTIAARFAAMSARANESRASVDKMIVLAGTLPAASARLDEGRKLADQIKELVDSAGRANKSAQDEFAVFAKTPEVVVEVPAVPEDPAILLAAAEKALDDGQVSAAQTTLKEARALYKSSGAQPDPSLYFLEGMANRKTADVAENLERRTRYLRKAQESFFQYLRSGDTVRLSAAKEQLGEIGPTLTDLLMAPEDGAE